MHLDCGQVCARERVPQRDTRMRECASIDHKSVEFRVCQPGDPVNERALVVRLKKLELRRALELRAQCLLEIRERRAAIDLRLALTQAVEVRAVDDRDLLHAPKSIQKGGRRERYFRRLLSNLEKGRGGIRKPESQERDSTTVLILRTRPAAP